METRSFGVADIVAALKVKTKNNFTFYLLFKAKPDIVEEICEKKKQKNKKQKNKKKNKKIIVPSSLYIHF